MSSASTSRPCPDCGLVLPWSDTAAYDGYYHTSAECWGLYSEVLAEEYGHAVLYGQVHQLTVDAYAVRHAGAAHPDKSVGVHLAGLYLMLKRDASPPMVPGHHKQLARSVAQWPHFALPDGLDDGPTVFDAALTESVDEHIERSREWARRVWAVWGSPTTTRSPSWWPVISTRTRCAGDGPGSQ
jgi:hypothetical protein